MKDTLKISAIFTIFLILIPMLGFLKYEPAASEPPDEEQTESEQDNAPTLNDDCTFLVLECETGQVLSMTMLEYVTGAVLGEMPADYEEEALKAQAVAAHTYALRRKMQQLSSPDPELKGAYISDDSTKYQAFFTPEQAQSFYGEKYAEYNARVEKAAASVINEILVSGGEPIVAAFHAVSSGKTESAEVVWGSAVDYLVPVESEGDISAPNYTEEKIFTEAELEARLTQSEYDITLPSDKSKWLKINSVSPSGTVTDVSAGDKHLSGAELRQLLSLRSACFMVEYDKDKGYTITTKGSGHGVGLSQYGANEMAKSGSNYREILLHYYSGAEIVTIDGNLS